jgi:fatty acid desaturase
MLTTVISRDYFFGERWRKQLNNQTHQNIDASKNWDIAIWIMAFIGLFAFIGGFASLVYAATELLT